MTKDDLKEVIFEAQRGAMGCGCCANERDRKEALGEAVEELWKVIDNREKEELTND